MNKPYLVVENSLFNRTAFLLGEALTIGTGRRCDIKLKDERAGLYHACVTRQDRQVFVEDMGCPSGTFLNERRIHEKTIMWEGDHLRCGNVVFRLLNDLVIQSAYDLEDTYSRQPAEYVSLQRVRPSLNIQRLEELLPQIPLFDGISREAVAQLVRNARLLFYEPDQVIFHQGDSSKSIFIVLDGHVEIFFNDHRRRKIQVAVLKDNQFFGEMAFLSGDPRNSTVRAVEVSYLCELQPKSLRRLIMRHPNVKQTILSYYHRRMGDLDEKKRKAGFLESREHLRYNLTLPVMIEPHPHPCADQGQCLGAYRLLTKDISLSGISARLKEIKDLSIGRLPVGHRLNLTLTLPPPFEAIDTQGVISRIEFPDPCKQRPFGLVGIKFVGLNNAQREKVSSLLQG